MSEIRPTAQEMQNAAEHLQRIVSPPKHAPSVEVVCVKQGWGQPRMAKSMYGAGLKLNGRDFEHGIGTHADSELIVKLPAPAARFTAFVGVDENPYTRSMPTPPRNSFSVSTDGRELWSCGPMCVSDAPVEADVDLRGATEFKLNVREAEGRIGGAHADWAGATVTLVDGTELHLGARPSASGPPISFVYGGKRSEELLGAWPMRYEPCQQCTSVKMHRLMYRDPETGLQCIVEMKEYEDFPALEWVVRFRNTGNKDTPILEDVQALDFRWDTDDTVALRRSKGSVSAIDDFLYSIEPIDTGSSIKLMPDEGRSSSGILPYFNLESGGNGIIAAIGWTGRWAAEFRRDDRDRMTIRAGMEKTHLTLHPGEEIRTPSIVLLFWEGEALRAHNLLRRFILAHHTPKIGGEPILAPLTCATWGGTPTHRHLKLIDTLKQNNAQYDYYWIDAGWYGPPGRHCPDLNSDWYQHVGNWNCNTTDHPNGMRPISDAARAAGMKFLLWIEPERAVYGTPMTQEHPEWFLGVPGPGRSMLFNLGIPEAREWMTDYVSGIIDEFAIDCYRQDFNMDPLSYWRENDAPDRQGMTEIRYIEGLYAFWDALLARHPGMIIDNCASGGRRLDIEMAGRGIPLWRSDYQCWGTYDPIGSQIHAHGISHWLPLSATGTDMRAGDTYNFRSNLSAGLSFMVDLWDQDLAEKDYPWDWHHRMTADFKRARPAFYGDYYPLTEPSVSHQQWMAYQMHRPDIEEGFVAAFRRDKSPFTSATFQLRGLEPQATYELEDADSGEKWTATGAELASGGVKVAMEKTRESRLVFYRKIPSSSPQRGDI